MLTLTKHALALLCVAGATFAVPAAASANTPTGVWIDHTGRAAIEITDCGGKLCGRMVWFKDSSNNAKGCGLQIIGDVKPMKNGKWDGGWILDPEKDSKYDVEITPLGDKLRVMGYAGMKFLSETFTWTRAGNDIQRCDVTAERTPPPAEPGVPYTPPSQDKSSPGPTPGPSTDSTPGPGPSTGPGVAPPPPDQPQKRSAAKKGCTLEIPYIKITVPCDDD